MVDNLHTVSIRVSNIERPGAIAVSAWLSLEHHPARLEKLRPRIDIIGCSHDHAYVVEHRLTPRVGC
jgi:hypothetical protein